MCTALQKALVLERDRNRDLKKVLHELSDKLQSQETICLQLKEREECTFTVFEEKVALLSEQLNNAHADLAEYEQKLKYMESANADIKASYNLTQRNSDDCKRLIGKLEEEVLNFKDEVEKSKEKELESTKEIEKLRKKLEQAEQVLKIKVKMLDDQNITITNLKQNLENKVRDRNSLSSEISSLHDQYQQRVAQNENYILRLEKQLSANELNIEKLEVIVEQLKSENQELVFERDEAYSKLESRNLSIKQIEAEVAKVRDVYKAREDKLQKEAKMSLEEKTCEIQTVRSSLDKCTTKCFGLERERDILMNTLRKAENDQQLMAEKNIQYEQDVRLLVAELDRRKITDSLRMEKLKAVFAE
ncbi:hypothetical protein BJ742DRAFT_444604 [Cladochytrium replicatum]|nr:hypothetical protein BJ742DRAFT_444604 [Cladochytrium replicatum]